MLWILPMVLLKILDFDGLEIAANVDVTLLLWLAVPPVLAML